MTNHYMEVTDMDKTIRIPKRRGYTIVPNGLLVEGKMSARAWGIYVYLLSRPDGWEVRARHLATVFTEGRDAIYTALKQLVEIGLMELETYRNEDGLPRKRYVLIDHDKIFNSPNPDSQDTGNQDTGFQDTENPAGTITDITNKKINQNSPANQDGHSTSEQSSDATHFTSNSQANVTRDDILPKEHWKHLRSKLQDVGKAIEQTGSFHSEVSQEAWEGFMFSLELVTDHLPYSWAIVDLTQNGKWTVNAKVATQYEAGKELLTLLNTAKAAA